MANTFKFGNGNWAVKDGYALAYNDVNNNFKPLPFDFTRASSATRVNKQGLVETVPSGKPRVDFTDNTSGHLLLEPSRTNLATYSEDIQQNFSTTDMTDTFEYGTAPNGLQKSTRLQLSNVGASRYVYTLTGTVSSGTTYNFSCYYKGIQGQTAYMYALPVGGTDVEKQITFTGDWQRVDITFTAGSSSNYVYIVDSRRGGNASDFEVWGTQVEQGSYATSYIPTEGSSVTRVAETCGQTVPDGIYGTNELSVIIDFEISGETPAFSNIFNANKSTTSSVGVVRQDSNNLLKPFLYEGGANVVDMSSTTLFSDNVRHKFAVGFKSGDSVLVVKGNVEDTSSATFSNFNFNQIHLNDLTTYFGYHTNIKIYDFKLYNTRLTDTELQNLTS